jgi:hypothetical protein
MSCGDKGVGCARRRGPAGRQRVEIPIMIYRYTRRHQLGDRAGELTQAPPVR